MTCPDLTTATAHLSEGSKANQFFSNNGSPDVVVNVVASDTELSLKSWHCLEPTINFCNTKFFTLRVMITKTKLNLHKN